MPKIYTKTGDKGETSLLGGKRISKSCLEMDAIGEIDELNAFLGILIEEIEDDFKNEKKKLLDIQRALFTVGANIASVQTTLVKVPKLRKTEVEKLEKWIDQMEKELPRLTQFILPTGAEGATYSFYVRAICRRAERQVIELSKQYSIDFTIKQYLNRLSDALFVLGRWFNMKKGIEEITWKK